MSIVLAQTWITWEVTGLGDIVAMDPTLINGTIDGFDVAGITSAVCGLQPEIVVSAEDSCFFSTSNTPTVLPPSSYPPFPPVWPYLFSTGTIYGRDHLSTNIKMIRRDEYVFDIAVILNGDAVDLSGCTLTMTAKWDVGDLDSDAVFVLSSPSDGIVITDATGGLATITIPSADTFDLPLHQVNLVYDIQLLTATAKIKTVLNGTLSIIPDVTEANP